MSDVHIPGVVRKQTGIDPKTGRGKGHWQAECSCGWSSAIHFTKKDTARVEAFDHAHQARAA